MPINKKKRSKGIISSPLRQLLEDNNYTAEKLVKETNIGLDTIYRFLRGRGTFRRKNLQAIADCFSISISELIDGTKIKIAALHKAKVNSPLRQLLIKNGCSVDKLAKETHVHKVTIHQVLKGRGTFRRETLQVIADYFEVPINHLVDGTKLKVSVPHRAKVNTPLSRLLTENNCLAVKLAKETHVGKTTVFNILKGKGIFQGEVLQVIADYFSVSVSELITGTKIKISPRQRTKVDSPLSRLLTENNCAVAKLAKETHVGKATINYILKGKGAFQREILQSLADYFSISIDELISGTKIDISSRKKNNVDSPLSRLLIENNCTIDKLARETNIHYDIILRLIKGKGTFKEKILQAIADYFSITISQLIGGTRINIYVMPIHRSTVNTPLARLLIENNCTVDKLSRIVHTAPTCIYQLLNGKGILRRKVLQAIADYFSVSIYQLIEGTEVGIAVPRRIKASMPLGRLLVNNDCTVAKLAKETNISPFLIEQVTKGQGVFNNATLQLIADYFSTSINELIDGTKIKIYIPPSRKAQDNLSFSQLVHYHKENVSQVLEETDENNDVVNQLTHQEKSDISPQSMSNAKVGLLLRQILIDRNISSWELAQEIGIGNNAVSRLVTDKPHHLHRKSLEKIAKFLSIPADQLIDKATKAPPLKTYGYKQYFTISQLLTNNNIPGVELARQIGINWQALQKIMSGKTRVPNRKNLGKIANFFNISVDQLLDEKTTEISKNRAKVSLNVEQLLIKHNITVSELAMETGLSQSIISRIVLDKIRNHKIKTLQTIANYFSISMYQLTDLTIKRTDSGKKNVSKIGLVIGQLLAEHNMSVFKFERQAGLPKALVRSILSGRALNPSVETLRKIANCFSISIDQLMGKSKINFSNKKIVEDSQHLSVPVSSLANDNTDEKTVNIHQLPMEIAGTDRKMIKSNLQKINSDKARLILQKLLMDHNLSTHELAKKIGILPVHIHDIINGKNLNIRKRTLEKLNNARISFILRGLLTDHDLSVSEFSDKINVSSAHIYRILNMRVSNSYIGTLEKIAHFFSIPIDQLIDEAITFGNNSRRNSSSVISHEEKIQISLETQIGLNLQRLLKEHNLSPLDLAKKIRIGIKYLDKIIKGKTSNLSTKNLQSIADYFSIPMSQLIDKKIAG